MLYCIIKSFECWNIDAFCCYWQSTYIVALPEHLKSCSCSSAKLCPFNWLGEWHRVYGARRGELRKYRDNHDKWQSHVNGLSDKRSARMRGIPLNISRGKVVMLLLFSVLQKIAKRVLCKLSLQVRLKRIWYRKGIRNGRESAISKSLHYDLLVLPLTFLEAPHSSSNSLTNANTYKISNSAKPRKACSSKHVISLLSVCKLRSDVAPLNVFRPIICSELCDKSLLKMETNAIFNMFDETFIRLASECIICAIR